MTAAKKVQAAGFGLCAVGIVMYGTSTNHWLTGAAILGAGFITFIVGRLM
jgi:hypothetical protein